MRRKTIAALCAATMLGWPIIGLTSAAYAQDGGRWERGGGRGERAEGRRGGDGGGHRARQEGGQRHGGDGGQQWRQRPGRDQGGGDQGGGGRGEGRRNRVQQAQQGGRDPAWRPPQQQAQPRVQGAPDRRGRFDPNTDGQAWRERRSAEGGRGPRVQGAPSQEWRRRQEQGPGPDQRQAARRRGPDGGETLRGGPDWRPNTQRQASPDERWRRQGEAWRDGGQRRDGWQGGDNRRPNYAGRQDYRRDGVNRGDRRGPSRAYTQLRPRTHSYSDWRAVPHGRYFDRGYASVIGRYYSHHYRWWGEPGWRTPYRPWRVGYYLPRSISYYPIPYDLYRLLPPPPYGCRYVRYGNDILLIAISSMLVLDAIVWLDDGDYYGYDDGYYDGGGYDDGGYDDDRYDDDYYYEY